MATVTGSVTQLDAGDSGRIAADVVARGAGVTVATARGNWPTKTGKSAAGLRVVRRGDTALVEGTADYTTEIKSKGVSPWETLIADPLDEAIRDVFPQEIVDALVRDLERRA